MTKRSVFTTISPLPPGVSREVVLDFLYSHVDMIDLNPLVVERHPIEAPSDADPAEKKCSWYSLTDRIDYVKGGKVSGNVSYTCAFHDLPNGIQTHCRAPLGVDVRDKWTLNGTLPGEPREPVEIGLGAPASGLYIREDVDLRCNRLMASFVKKNLKRSHAALVNKLVEKARFASAEMEVGGGARRGLSHMWSPPSYLPHGSYSASSLSPDGYQEEVSPIVEDDNSPVEVEDDQPRRIPSVRLITPYQVSRSDTPPPSDNVPDEPRPQSRSRLHEQAQAEFHLQCPPILRVPVQAPPPPTWAAPAAPTRTAPPPPPLSPPIRTAPSPPTRTAPLPPPPSPAPAGGALTPPSSPPPSSPSPLTATRVGPSSPCYYPAPLRIHDRSSQQQRPAGAWDCDDQHHHLSSSPSTSIASAPSSPRLFSPTPTVSTTVTAWSSSDYEHPDYPHLSPYWSASTLGGEDEDEEASGSSSSTEEDDDEDEPLPPRAPAFMWKGYDFAEAAAACPPGEVVVVVEEELEHPACLRPGGLSCRLEGPFIAELEC